MIQANKKLNAYTKKVKESVIKDEKNKAFIFAYLDDRQITLNQAGTLQKMTDLFYNMLIQNPNLITPVLEATKGYLAEFGELPKID